MIYDFRFAILRIAAAALIGLTPLAGRASLSAVVTPGYQYPLDGSVPLSYPLLNLLATPTITIYGTIGGSNTLSPGSVTGTELNANVLTGGGGLAFDGGNPPGIEVATGGVLTNMLNTNDWQWPLSQRNAASLVQLSFNTNQFTASLPWGTTNGPLSLVTNLALPALTVTNMTTLNLYAPSNAAPEIWASQSVFAISNAFYVVTNRQQLYVSIYSPNTASTFGSWKVTNSAGTFVLPVTTYSSSGSDFTNTFTLEAGTDDGVMYVPQNGQNVTQFIRVLK